MLVIVPDGAVTVQSISSRQFRQLPLAPVLVSPLNNATNLQAEFLLDWNAFSMQ